MSTIEATKSIEGEVLFSPNNPLYPADTSLPLDFPSLTALVRGDMPSLRKGPGPDKDGLREYEFGDDLRKVDWSATARDPEGTLQVTDRYKDMYPTFHIIADLRSAIHPGIPESILAASAAQLLTSAAVRYEIPTMLFAVSNQGIYFQPRLQGGPIGYHQTSLDIDQLLKLPRVTKEDPLPEFIPLSAGIVQKPQEAETSDDITLAQSLRWATRFMSHSVITVISGFRRDSYRPDDLPDGWQPALAELKARNNQLLAVETTNDWYGELPELADVFVGKEKIVEIAADDPKGQEGRKVYTGIEAERKKLISKALGLLTFGTIELSAEEPMWQTSFIKQLVQLNHSRW